MSNFSTKIKPYVERELAEAARSMEAGNPKEAFQRLENAHVIGQASTFHHVKVHVAMLKWAIRQKDLSEFLGQILRIGGAATKTAIGLVPTGNTGGSNVSPFKPMPLKPEHQRIIEKARTNA